MIRPSREAAWSPLAGGKAGQMVRTIEGYVEDLNGVLFSTPVVLVLLVVGLLFTVWSAFGQYRALTHGSAVVRGKYDDKEDPGAINHFQALSAALSATVGLGNIGGVAAAVALGGPGAVLWMWLIGVVGMALKMTEVTLAMLYRNTDDPENPHGGPMFVVRDGLRKWGLGPLGSAIGGLFCVTLLVSAITGGNMFQSWNVAEVTTQYTEIPRVAVGIVLAIVVGLVIIGGIKRIGAVAGRIVPFMCALYLLAGAYVLLANIGEIPAMLMQIVRAGLGLEQASASGAFLGAAFGTAVSFGIQRALFSSEAGQGSSPIAHSAAKTDEPVREGVVAGLEPFIDTIVVCTVTALVIMVSGAYNAGPETSMDPTVRMTQVQRVVLEDGTELRATPLIEDEANVVFQIVAADEGTDPVREIGRTEIASMEPIANEWAPSSPVLPDRTAEARRISDRWKRNDKLMLLAEIPDSEGGAPTLARAIGTVRVSGIDDYAISWTPIVSEERPVLQREDRGEIPVYGYYVGAGLTAHAFDRVTPGLGMWLVMLASWLFAVSTMISWSYYGEQGVYYMFGRHADKAVLPYKLIYCLLIIISALPFIKTEDQLNIWTTLGLGLMLWVNIPIMVIFGYQAMGAYHDYFGRQKRGELEQPRTPPRVTDLVEGKDVE